MILPFQAHVATPGASSVVSEAAVELGDAAAFPSPTSARATLDRLLATGRLVPRSRPELFVVEMAGDGCTVAGVLAVVSADHEVRPHERVLSDRVSSLTRHLDASGAEAVPVTLAHRRHQAIADRVAAVASGNAAARGGPRGVGRKGLGCRSGYRVGRPPPGALYIVDGHHRVAAAAQRGTGFLALIVPAEQLRLTAFHRVVLDGAEDSGWLLRRLQQMGMRAAGPVEPAPGEVSVAVGGAWYTLPLPSAAERGGTAARLDASRLHRPRLGAAARSRRGLHCRSGGGGSRHCGIGGSHRAGRHGRVRPGASFYRGRARSRRPRRDAPRQDDICDSEAARRAGCPSHRGPLSGNTGARHPRTRRILSFSNRRTLGESGPPSPLFSCRNDRARRTR